MRHVTTAMIISTAWLISPRFAQRTSFSPGLEAHVRRHQDRQLEENATFTPKEVGPTRECGQIINQVTRAQIVTAGKIVFDQLLPSDLSVVGDSILKSLVLYGVRAQVVCGSCNEMRTVYADAPFLDDGQEQERFAFNSYCGKDKFAANVTYSGLLLIPTDPESEEPVIGELKSHLAMTSFSFGEQEGAPSEYWLQDFDSFNSTDADVILAVVLKFREGIFSVMKASSGVVVISPDYLGFGHSFKSTKGAGIFDLYQQTAAVAFLKGKSVVESSGCTLVGKQSSASGYSEGGISAIAGAHALKGLGQEILNVDSGGAPYSLSQQVSFAIDQGASNQNLRAMAVVFANSFSSSIPDLKNTDEGQNPINDSWRQTIAQMASKSLSVEYVDSVLPSPWTDIFETTLVDKTMALLAQNTSDFCVNSTTGVDDILCQTLKENSYTDAVEATPFPVSICHSPDDELVPITQAPDTTANGLVSKASIFSQGPTGNHGEAFLFCGLFQILQFTTFLPSPLGLTGVTSLPSNSSCASILTERTDTSYPPSAAPSPSTPTTSVAASLFQSPILAGTGFLVLWLTQSNL